MAAGSTFASLTVIGITALVATAVSVVLVGLLRWLAARWHVTVLSGRLWQSPVVLTVVLASLQPVVRAADQPWSSAVGHLLQIGLICSIAWLLIVLVRTAEKAALAKHPDQGLQDGRSRHVRTKITLLQRVAVALIVTVALGAALWTIPQVRAVGATLLASAGVLSIIAGLAAQTSLANIFAGVQIAFTDGIRVGDIVVVEGSQGRIEEITLTYIVVEVWDGSRLIMPCTYFTTTPFENRSHAGTSIVGQARVSVDWTVSLADVRGVLDQVLRDSGAWDGRVAELRIEDSAGQQLMLTAQFSAAADRIEALRFQVREALVAHLALSQPAALPRARQESVAATGVAHIHPARPLRTPDAQEA